MDETIRRVAVLYADVSGSTRLYEEHGEEVARADVATCPSVPTGVADWRDGRRCA